MSLLLFRDVTKISFLYFRLFLKLPFKYHWKLNFVFDRKIFLSTLNNINHKKKEKSKNENFKLFLFYIYLSIYEHKFLYKKKNNKRVSGKETNWTIWPIFCIPGPHWLKNLFFTYLLTLRSVVKAAPYWKKVNFYTGDLKEDNEVKRIVLEMVNTAK